MDHVGVTEVLQSIASSNWLHVVRGNREREGVTE